MRIRIQHCGREENFTPSPWPSIPRLPPWWWKGQIIIQELHWSFTRNFKKLLSNLENGRKQSKGLGTHPPNTKVFRTVQCVWTHVHRTALDAIVSRAVFVWTQITFQQIKLDGFRSWTSPVQDEGGCYLLALYDNSQLSILMFMASCWLLMLLSFSPLWKNKWKSSRQGGKKIPLLCGKYDELNFLLTSFLLDFEKTQFPFRGLLISHWPISLHSHSHFPLIILSVTKVRKLHSKAWKKG